jgi:WD40 repeat protein
MRKPMVVGLFLLVASLCARSPGQEVRPRSVLKGHTSFVYSVAVAPDGRTLASGERRGSIICWDARTERPRWMIEAHAGGDHGYTHVMSVAFSPDGKTLASGGWDQTVRLWDAATGELKLILPHEDLVYCVAFSPDGKTLASGDHEAVVRLWEVRTGRLGAALRADRGSVGSVAFSPDGKTLASGGYSLSKLGVVRLWDLAERAIRLEIPSQTTRAVAFSPDGRIVASTGYKKRAEGNQIDGAVRLWDARTGELKRAFTVGGDGRTSAGPVAFSPDGRLVASGGAVGERVRERRPGAVYVWDVGTGRLLWTQACHDDDVTSLAFLPDGKTLVSGGRDQAVKLWEIAGRLGRPGR